ncbi:transposase [Saccharopolyspora sp. TS4A08]|uniref:Transposase n=1 Tax=Saccharopolyspora ipomoeae TaxID=3042027 RepID=A0ABT6PI11_9PSEU|nr:transposase [Saccharopolyspora sp. TS4A08]MDI2027635.1 transposase [Saccharopolyspora sp. TS4A08]
MSLISVTASRGDRRAVAGRLALAVDVTCWLRPEAHTSPQRVLCHTYGRGKDTHIMVPGWPYLVVALETGRSSWTAPLDIQRLVPGETVVLTVESAPWFRVHFVRCAALLVVGWALIWVWLRCGFSFSLVAGLDL